MGEEFIAPFHGGLAAPVGFMRWCFFWWSK